MEVKVKAREQFYPGGNGGGRRREGLLRSIDEMDALARGIEAKQDLMDGRFHKVTERTVEAAIQLGIPERKIQKWVIRRATVNSQRGSAIASLLSRF